MFGEVGADTVDSCSASVILLKLILLGSFSSGNGWLLKVPEVEPCLPVLGLIPGDFRGYVVFLGNLGGCLQFRGSISNDLLNR